MARNQLPEGVGKKIVEALKRQAEADITPLQQPAAGSVNSSIPAPMDTPKFNDADFEDFKDAPVSAQTPAPAASISSVNDNMSAFEIKFKDEPVQQEKEAYQPVSFDMQNKKDDMFTPNVKESFSNTMFSMQNKKDDIFAQPAQDSYANTSFNVQNKTEQPVFKQQADAPQTLSFTPQAQTGMLSYSGIPFNEEQKISQAAPAVTVNIPQNVAVLKNLIATLPAGVTKQTGAQIIRQTLEAMGLSMASVLKEAQEVQEELSTNTRECMLRIQEAKTNIMQWEQTAQEYQKNMQQINDLVSLFLLTDKKGSV